MSDQYLRDWRLVVGGDSGEGLDLSALRIKFQVKKSDAQTPNAATITIYNLADDTARRIKDEFTRVDLEAGYIGNRGMIFSGTIKQTRVGKENGTDTFLSIAAADGDVAYNHAVVSKPFEAGMTLNDQVKAATDALSEYGVTEGFIPDLGGQSLPRGKTFHGMARDVMRQATESAGATWSIQDGKAQVIKRTSHLPGSAIVINSKTGMVGIPEQSETGVKVRCLLNPSIRIGGLIKLNTADVLEADLFQQLAPSSSASSSSSTPDKPPASLSADGLYRVWMADYTGDTRGNDWFCDLTTLSIDASAPAGEELEEQ